MSPDAQQATVQALQAKLEYEQKLVQLINRIHAAKSLDSIFIELQSEILDVLDADRMTFYAVDYDRRSFTQSSSLSTP